MFVQPGTRGEHIISTLVKGQNTNKNGGNVKDLDAQLRRWKNEEIQIGKQRPIHKVY